MNLNLNWIDFNCPKCRYINSVQVIDVRTEIKVFCPNCKMTIQLIDKNASMSNGVRKVESSLKNLRNSFKNFNK
tara:strand:- start:141 stop:362 length:222 start_codon:yes stop_codon:yes gene_type:complete